jgi:UDP-2-acetamido-2-deoxy-ribo-hexuluronate aminotransferase
LTFNLVLFVYEIEVNMQFIDLEAQQKRIFEKIQSNIHAVLKHGKYIMGPEVAQLETTLCEYVGAEQAIACASGTDALLLALMAKGVGPGDAIFTTPFTFIATAEVICLLGAVPVFVDIDPETFNMRPQNLELAIKAVISRDRTIYPLPEKHNSEPADIAPRGVIAVDLFGLPAGYDRINSIASEFGLFVIEDAAQSFGGEFEDKKACNLAEIGCTSFFPAKPLGCYGDGGMCFTNDEKLAHAMASLRLHGKGQDKYDNVRIGINGRIDTIQAAILLAKFEIFAEEIELRRKLAARYTDALMKMNNGLTAPAVPQGYKSAWAQYSILASDPEHRKEIQARLKEAGIPTAVYYPKPLHLQTAFASFYNRENEFPVSEDYSSRIFSIPMHPYLRTEDQEKIIGLLAQ